MNAAVLMLRNNKRVPDSVMIDLASDDRYRGMLYDKLVKNKMESRFPERYKNQHDLARSYVMMQNDYDRMDSLVYLDRRATVLKGKSGYIYFFKYRVQHGNDWKIAMSGLQPLNNKNVAADPLVSELTDVKIRSDEPLDDQLNNELKKLLFTWHKSGRNFYKGNDGYMGLR
jgi:hypothetical protein